MKAFQAILSIPVLAILACFNAGGQCTVNNEAFQDGESITYKVFYNWGQLWVGAGEVNFSVKQMEFRGKQAYHFVGKGNTYKSYDWFFKVRDTYEAYSDTSSLLPYYFKRNVREGDHYFTNQYVFDRRDDKAYSVRKLKKNPVRLDTIDIPKCTYDVLSIIYFSRCIDFSKYKPLDTIPITIILDQEVMNIYIRYLGKEIIKTDKHGKFRCIKFSPLLVAGSIFKEGEEMKVWVTDDKNKIPLMVESPIVVGSIKAKLKSWKGLRNPLTSKIKE